MMRLKVTSPGRLTGAVAEDSRSQSFPRALSLAAGTGGQAEAAPGDPADGWRGGGCLPFGPQSTFRGRGGKDDAGFGEIGPPYR